MKNAFSKVEVTVGDLQVVVNIIEAATQRGAFRAPELKGVGEFFEMVSSLIPKENISIKKYIIYI